MSSQPETLLTPREYLEIERAAEFKSEFYRGQMFAMTGASRYHNLIVANLIGEIRQALKNSDCEVYPSDLRIKISTTGLYTYPDVTIVCGKPEFEDGVFDTLLNPDVLIEVLSKSTEAYDRGDKSAHYRRLPSLRHYVLVAQDRCSVESYSRQSDNSWRLNEILELSESLKLKSPQMAILAREIYRNVGIETDRRPGPPVEEE